MNACKQSKDCLRVRKDFHWPERRPSRALILFVYPIILTKKGTVYFELSLQSFLYPFTAPAVTPFTMYFCIKINTIITGIIDITNPAKAKFHLFIYWPKKLKEAS